MAQAIISEDKRWAFAKKMEDLGLPLREDQLSTLLLQDGRLAADDLPATDYLRFMHNAVKEQSSQRPNEVLMMADLNTTNTGSGCSGIPIYCWEDGTPGRPGYRKCCVYAIWIGLCTHCDFI